eukprot:scaffold68042_cov46-Prasinocladus_malaysianus.AAC.1
MDSPCCLREGADSPRPSKLEKPSPRWRRPAVRSPRPARTCCGPAACQKSGQVVAKPSGEAGGRRLA